MSEEDARLLAEKMMDEHTYCIPDGWHAARAVLITVIAAALLRADREATERAALIAETYGTENGHMDPLAEIIFNEIRRAAGGGG